MRVSSALRLQTTVSSEVHSLRVTQEMRSGKRTMSKNDKSWRYNQLASTLSRDDRKTRFIFSFIVSSLTFIFLAP